MSYNYTPLKESATALLTKFGRQYTFTRTTKGAYSAATGQTTDTTSTFTKYACIFDFKTADAGDFSAAAKGSRFAVEAGDRRMLAEGYAYEVGDTVVVDSVTYTVMAVSDTKPAGTSLAVSLQIRR